MKKLISILLFLPLVACSATPSKSELDAEVKRLCAIDGGIKIYRTVKLPAEKFDQWGMVNFYKPDQGKNALGTEYVLEEKTDYYREGSPQMARHHYRILNRSSQTLLGETILYGRGGGDLPGPWHESSFTCPTYAQAGLNVLLRIIFVKIDKESRE